MPRGDHLSWGLAGVSLAALTASWSAPALAATTAATAADAAQAPAAPPARGERLNPTGRSIALTVPAKDGATYLGDMPLTIGSDDTLSFPTERALSLLNDILAAPVIEALRTSLAGKASISPADLTPAGIGLEYDPQTLELKFLIPVEKRASRSLSVSPLDRARLGNVSKPAGFSAYLNIRGSLDLVEDGPDNGFGKPVLLLNAATRIGQIVAEGDALWTPGGLGADFQRLGNRLVYDDLDHLIRFSAGDLQSQARGFQVAPEIAGLSLYRSYSVLNPQQIIRPRGDQAFTLERPSTIEVIVNGQQVRRLQLAPGNYNLRDFPFAQGANDIRLNVLDDAGRSEVLRFNIFLDQTQLAKGLSEFGLYAGVRAPLGIRGPRYTGELIASGFYRRGVSDFLTLGANFQADKDVQMGGFEAVFATALGAFGTNAAFSHSRRFGDGSAFQATFQRLIQHPNGQTDTLNLFAERRSLRFSPVSFFLPTNPYQFEVGGGYSHAFNSGFYGGIDGRYSRGRGTVADVHNYRVTAGWRISPTMSLSAEGRYQQDLRGREVSGFISFTARLGRYSSVRTEYDTRDNRARASYQTLHGSGVGSYNVSADVERSDFGSDASVSANYFTNRAELGFSHFAVFNGDFGGSVSQRSTFRLGTSLAVADGAFSVGRPIYDSFAIVKPHRSLATSDVVIEPFVNGYTANSGALGAATMPSLSSYSERTIPFDLRDAPVGVDVGQGSFKVFPAYRSGYRLEVGSDYHLTALGTMLDVDGEPVSLVSGTATEMSHPDRAGLTIFTNRQGRFGAVGLAPGKWRLQMLDVKKSTFVIDVPANADGIVRLGEVRAEKGS